MSAPYEDLNSIINEFEQSQRASEPRTTAKLEKNSSTTTMSQTEAEMRAEDERRRRAQPRSEADERVESMTRKLIAPRARQLAKEAGIIDPDDVRWLDIGLIDVSEERVSGLTQAIADLKARKPHYFKAVESRERSTPRSRPGYGRIQPGDTDHYGDGEDWNKKSVNDFSQDMSRKFGVHI